MFMKNYIITFFIFIFSLANATAQSTDAPKELTFIERLITMLPMVAIIFGIFYFLVILPQRKQEIEAVKILDNLKKGDQMITKSGIIGKVFAISDDIITLEISKDCRVKFQKTAIQSKYEVKKA